MVYKNINTATNAILGRVSGCQHHHINARYGRQVYNNTNTERSIYSKPKDFDVWFMEGMEFYKSKGYKFQWLNLVTIKVTLPNGRTGTRTIEDFEDEYKNEYRKGFPSCN